MIESWIPNCGKKLVCMLSPARQLEHASLGAAMGVGYAVQGNALLKPHVEAAMSAGGVSMGDKDFIKPLLEQSGQMHFGKVLLALLLMHLCSCCLPPLLRAEHRPALDEPEAAHEVTGSWELILAHVSGSTLQLSTHVRPERSC